MSRRCPFLGCFHAEAVVLGTRKIDGIIPRCFLSKKYCTISSIVSVTMVNGCQYLKRDYMVKISDSV